MQMRTLPIAMGLMMGMMLPWMLHMSPGAGLGFILAHVAVLGGAGLLAVLGLRFRVAQDWARRILSHRPNKQHLVQMLGSAVIGFGLVCLFCLMIGGSHGPV